MTSRWAYEALAVNQFKANKYESQFYKYDKAISEAQYKKTYWNDKMTAKVSKVENELGDVKKNADTEKDLQLLRDELNKEYIKHSKLTRFVNTESLYLGKVNKTITSALKDYLSNANPGTLKQYYIDNEKLARDKRNEVIEKYSTPEQKTALVKLGEDYDNESLNTQLKNSSDFGDKCLEINGMLIQRTEPIFLDPTDNYGRAHFFAPRKKLLGTYYQTFLFNLCVIWGMSLLMMVTLYFDLLKKLLDGLGKLPSMLTRKK
jgi:hypothetical protein